MVLDDYIPLVKKSWVLLLTKNALTYLWWNFICKHKNCKRQGLPIVPQKYVHGEFFCWTMQGGSERCKMRSSHVFNSWRSFLHWCLLAVSLSSQKNSVVISESLLSMIFAAGSVFSLFFWDLYLLVQYMHADIADVLSTMSSTFMP